MGYTRGLCHADDFQFDLPGTMLEQSDPFTEQYRHQVNMCFVKKSSL